MNYDYIITSIRFNLNGDILINNFKWKKYQGEDKILDFGSAFQVFPEDAEIKIAKLETRSVRNFA